MSYLDKIQRCNRRDLRRYLPFVVDGQQVGWLTPARAAVLKRFAKAFSVSKTVGFHASLSTPAKRSRAIADLAPELRATGLFLKPRGELYGVRNTWSAPALFRIDRGFIVGFGLRAYGVHVNGIVHKASRPHLWIGTRSKDVRVEPGKLDNMVAGGQPAGLSLTANLVKECAEEAHIGARLARTAKFASMITYAFETPEGLKMDTLYCYDLVMGAERPRASEEITRYQLMPLKKVLSLARGTNRFKFNVSLVIIDYAIRQGVITPENEPAFDAIVAGLHEIPQPVV
jgi:hypothetical protein